MNPSIRTLLCVGVLSASAPAHPSARVKSEELHLFRDRAVLFLRYEVTEPRHASDLRERFDADADGSLSNLERDGLSAYLQDQATESLRLYWDGEPTLPVVKLRATHGLDRALPSAYPITIYWQLDFTFHTPLESTQDTSASPETRARSVEASIPRVLRFEDAEARWNSSFQCQVRLAPGVEEEGAVPREAPRSYDFDRGKGSFRLRILTRSP